MFSIDTGRLKFPNHPWGVVGTGRDQGSIASFGLSIGCDTMRVGFEDSLYRANGHIAAHNHELIEDVVRIGHLLGRKPATPAEARRILGITG